jgi:hypothetical protein
MGKEIEVATGVGIDEVKRLLGHSSIQITVNTYGHFLPGKERQTTVTNAMAAARKESKLPKKGLRYKFGV